MPAWVFHRGALGDSVLAWPLLRALSARAGVVFVADGSKALLAAGVLGARVRGVDAESRRFAALWADRAGVEEEQGVARVIALGAGGNRGVWEENARRMFPGAAVEVVEEQLDRNEARALAARFGGMPPIPVRDNPGGPVVLHVGAGAREKWWPLERWANLRRRLGGRLEVVAGEVEAERFTAEQRAVFEEMGGRFLGQLAELKAVVARARVVVACDTGPAHMAAQMGVRTVALFGPTDPERWAPIGPAVRVVAPGLACGMEWVGVEFVQRVVQDMMELGPAGSRGVGQHPAA